MIYQELLQELTESFLRSLFSQVSAPLSSDFDSLDSFHVLKIIRRLESEFGRLPKSLLFEHFNLQSLAHYFATHHEKILSVRFAEQLPRAGPVESDVQPAKPAIVDKGQRALGDRGNADVNQGPIRISEQEINGHPELAQLVQNLFERYKSEGCVSRGTRK